MSAATTTCQLARRARLLHACVASLGYRDVVFVVSSWCLRPFIKLRKGLANRAETVINPSRSTVVVPQETHQARVALG